MATTLKVLSDTVAAPNLLWDTVWTGDGFGGGQSGDWAPSSPTEPKNRGGLRARAPLETAIILCWMTDARADPTDELPDDSGDPRGWAGDAVDPSVAPIGSKFWLLRRSELTQEVADRAVLYGRKALQPLIRQGACATITVTAKPNFTQGRLELRAELYRIDGSLAAAQNFDLLWKLSIDQRYPLDP